jgi:hypothetical protein
VERFWNAAGEVKPFENDAEVGLEGRLNQQLQTYPDPFHEMDIKYAKPKDTSRNTYVLVTEVASQETRTLDDPFGGPWWSSSQSWVFQVWGQEQEYVDTWLINSWAVRHMVEMFPGIRALLAE